ncbi:unnamed protein product [Saccharomyces cerevisiae]|nr:unnamed protein product [Saccharomyces cerevisiae]GMC38839.1 unnamed protein product [Saccharomyces cerevisiae]
MTQLRKWKTMTPKLVESFRFLSSMNDEDDVENDEDDVSEDEDEDDVSEDEDEESWEEKGAIDETKAELEVKRKPEDADGSAVAEDVPDDSIL